jgi:hypothetical protein
MEINEALNTLELFKFSSDPTMSPVDMEALDVVLNYFKDAPQPTNEESNFDSLKHTDILIAIDECEMVSGEKALIIGKEYPIQRLVDEDIVVIATEVISEQWFLRSNLHEYFKLKK